MKKKFNSIGLIGRQRSGESITTLTDLISHLQQKHYDLILEEETANLIGNKSLPSYPRNEFGKHCDLAIVVGGDGSILNAAKAVVDHNVPVLGINRGRLGFLADIHPNELTSRLDAVLSGEFVSEQRFLLDVSVLHDNTTIHSDAALNDVVLMPGDYAHMIEFDIFIDDQLVCGERADGRNYCNTNRIYRLCIIRWRSYFTSLSRCYRNGADVFSYIKRSPYCYQQ